MLGEEGARREIDAEKWTAGGGGGRHTRNAITYQGSEARQLESERGDALHGVKIDM